MARFGKILVFTALLLSPFSCIVAQTDTTEIKGYENNDDMGGPKSIGRQLEVNNKGNEFAYRHPIKTMKSWYDWKDKVNAEHGIKFGINYTALAIYSTQLTANGTDQFAGSGILDMQGGWTLLNRKKKKNTGTLYLKMNSRHLYTGKGSTSPMFHGLQQSGYYGLPGTGFRRYTLRINELNWQQNLLNNRAGFVIGKVDLTNYFNFHGLIIPWQHFIGYGASVSGTVNWGNQGLGAVIMGRPTEKLYAMAGLVDVYGDQYQDGDFFDLGSYYKEGKFMYMAEVGYVPSYAERYFKKISLTAWYSDSYTNVSDIHIAQGQGLAFSAHWFFKERYAPFVRVGYSNGVGENTFYKTDVQIGHGYRFLNYDMLGVSMSYNNPNFEAKDQMTAEVFYRMNLSAHLEVTPSTQFVLNPALNPDAQSLFYFGLRARATL